MGKNKKVASKVKNVVKKGAQVGWRLAKQGQLGTEAQTIAKSVSALTRVLKGSGDYRQTSGNALMAGTARAGPQAPSFSKRERSLVMTHREYLGDLLSGSGAPSAFTSATYPLNPGLPATFPFLSQLAQNFVTYRFKSLVFEFRSTSGMVTSNQALGTVCAAAQYNSLEPAFTSKYQLENYVGAASVVPSQNLLIGIECNRKDLPLSHLYVRTSTVTTDIRLYDMGTFTIATQGIATANCNLGEVWVSYEVELFQPKLYDALNLASGYWSISGTSAGSTTLTTGGVLDPNNSLTGLSVDGNGVITFGSQATVGVYAIYGVWAGSSAATTAFTITVAGNCSKYSNTSQTRPYYYDTWSQTGTSTTNSFIAYVNFKGYLPATASTVTINPGVLPASITHWSLMLFPIPYSL